MKQIIMEKLFDNKELTNEEIIFIGNNLQSGVTIPFDHKNENSISACGISGEEADAINKGMLELSKGVDTLSNMVELVEIKALTNEKVLRAVIVNSLRKDHTRLPSIEDLTGQDTIQKLIEKILKKGGKNKDNSE